MKPRFRNWLWNWLMIFQDVLKHGRRRLRFDVLEHEKIISRSFRKPGQMSSNSWIKGWSLFILGPWVLSFRIFRGYPKHKILKSN